MNNIIVNKQNNFKLINSFRANCILEEIFTNVLLNNISPVIIFPDDSKMKVFLAD